jgi:hypothetical protein
MLDSVDLAHAADTEQADDLVGPIFASVERLRGDAMTTARSKRNARSNIAKQLGDWGTERELSLFPCEVRHPPQSGWLDGLDRLKGGWLLV